MKIFIFKGTIFLLRIKLVFHVDITKLRIIVQIKEIRL